VFAMIGNNVFIGFERGVEDVVLLGRMSVKVIWGIWY